MAASTSGPGTRPGRRGARAVNWLHALLLLAAAGPCLGFGMLGYNAWALGCRRVWLHMLFALIAIAAAGRANLAVSHLAASLPAPEAGPPTGAAFAQIAVQVGSLLAAAALVAAQSGAYRYRKTHGPVPTDGVLKGLILPAILYFPFSFAATIWFGPTARAFTFWYYLK